MKPKNLVIIGNSLAYAIITLGTIHVIATYSPLIKGNLNCLERESLSAMLYMSLMCGASLIIAGIVILMLLKKIREFSFLSKTLLALGVFLALNGILSVLYMFHNPFAWISLLLNLSMFVVSIMINCKPAKK